jgi:hypothetical protein
MPVLLPLLGLVAGSIPSLAPNVANNTLAPCVESSPPRQVGPGFDLQRDHAITMPERARPCRPWHAPLRPWHAPLRPWHAPLRPWHAPLRPWRRRGDCGGTGPRRRRGSGRPVKAKPSGRLRRPCLAGRPAPAGPRASGRAAGWPAGRGRVAPPPRPPPGVMRGRPPRSSG